MHTDLVLCVLYILTWYLRKVAMAKRFLQFTVVLVQARVGGEVVTIERLEMMCYNYNQVRKHGMSMDPRGTHP